MLRKPSGKPLIRDPLADSALLSEAIIVRRKHYGQPYDDEHDESPLPDGAERGL